MKNRKKQRLFFFALLLFLVLGANFVYALEIKYPNIPGAIPPQDFINDPSIAPEEIPSYYLKYIVNSTIWAAGLIALAVLIYGGTRYLTSTGRPEAMVSARNQITAAFFGLLLLFSSYLILNILSPELTILKVSPLEKIELIERRYVSPPSISAAYSSIDVELPFGRIIEKIFETYISDLPDSVVRTPRIIKIKTLAEETKEIADKLKQQSEDLKEVTGDCSCDKTRPCCEIPNPGPGCKDNICRSKPGTTSDPCSDVREDIQNTEDKNLEQIALLEEEQRKTIEEIKDLKTELKRLERAESFIKDCSATFKNSYSQFLSLKNFYETKGGIVREISFWDDIIIPYLNKEERQVSDWATFLCTIGGDILPSTRALYEEEKAEETVVKEKPKACSAEIPVGEIIDRTKRITRLLINRLETLVEWDKKMIDAVDKLQVLVSQCSSQRCFSECFLICPTHGSCWCEKRAITAPQYSEGPCPKSEIADQLKEIQEIQEEINKIVTEEKKEEIGIIPLIDPDDPNSVVSKMLGELDKIQKLDAGIRGIRYPLQVCGTGEYGETLLTCQRARGNIDPEGRTIGICCMDQLMFRECLEECYLEEGVEKYKICLQGCLDKKAEEARTRGVPMPEQIARCRHLLNFFCCVK